MRFILLILFSTICFSASAQWYHIGGKKKFVRPAAEELTLAGWVAKFPVAKVACPKLAPVHFARSSYSIEAEEAVVMKIAQHHMRFREYHEASYSFTDLAHLLTLQSRYSEAVWYLLQSNNISRGEGDDKHTIENLVDLATVKTKMNEIELAEQDLTEAHDLAYAKGLTNYVETVDLAMQYITQNKLPKQKPVLIYADGAEKSTKSE
jgi:hypothetical protein